MSIYPDISHHHPVTNWGKLKENCPFLITKATEGTSYIDPTLRNFIRECEQRKIPYWLYTFLRNGNELEQTKYMVEVCKPIVGKNFIGYILDIEQNNNQESCKAALNWLKGQCKKQMIYTMYGQHHRYTDLIETRPKSCAWWEARYNDTAHPCHAGADLWQYTDKGKAEGVTGLIDLNRLTGRLPEQWFMQQEDITKVNVELNTLCRDTECPEVLAWKRLLKGAGYSEGIKMTDRFGSKAEARTKEWQKDNGLYPDGVVGTKSWKKMLLG